MSNTTLPAEKLSASIAKNLLKVLSISDDPKICEEFQHIRDSLTDDEVTEQLIERLTPFIERGMMVPVTQMKSMMKKMPVTLSEEFSADSDDDFSPEESPHSYTQSFSCPSNDNSREATQSFQIALPGEFSQESDGEAAYFQVKQQETAYFPVQALAGEFSQESDGETVYFPVKQTKVEAEFTEDEAACGPVEEFSHESDDEPGFNYQCQPVPPVFSQPAYHHSNNDKEFSSQDEL